MAARPSPAGGKKPASIVPLPAYARRPTAPSKTTSPAANSPARSKLMALNSKIMAAQREWESTKNTGDKEDDDGVGSNASNISEGSASSDSSLISISDDAYLPEGVFRSGPGISRIVPGPASTAGIKRKIFEDSVSRIAASAAKKIRQAAVMRKKSQNSSALSSDALSNTRPGRHSASSSARSLAVRQDPKKLKRPEARVAAKQMLEYSANDSIFCRADGMPYEDYRVSKHRFRSMCGAIVPTNYKLNKNAPGRRFECPDRLCFKGFANERSLGGHFSAAHKGNAYNDNCDGTLTKVGTYPRTPGESYRAIVVSRISVNGSEEEIWDDGCSPVPFTDTHVALTHPDPFTYVTSLLTTSVDHTKKLRVDYVRALCELPKRRNLPKAWCKFHEKKDISTRMFAIAVAYVTGREIFGVDMCTTTTGAFPEPGYRLNRVCVAVAPELSEVHKRAHFTPISCMSCLYYAQLTKGSTACQWQGDDWFMSRYRHRVDGNSDSEENDTEFSFSGMGAADGKAKKLARAVDSVIKAGKAAKLTIPKPAAAASSGSGSASGSASGFASGSASASASASPSEPSLARAVAEVEDKQADYDDLVSQYTPSADGSGDSSELEAFYDVDDGSEGANLAKPAHNTSKAVAQHRPQVQVAGPSQAISSPAVYKPVQTPVPIPSPAVQSPVVYQPTPPPQVPAAMYQPPPPAHMANQGHSMPSGSMQQPQQLAHHHYQFGHQWQPPATQWQPPPTASGYQPIPGQPPYQGSQPVPGYQTVHAAYLSPNQHSPFGTHFSEQASTQDQSSAGRTTRSSAAVPKGAAEQPATTGSSGRHTVPAQTPSDRLEMEPWEIAPGRITDAKDGENIGYSSSYLNGREPTEVCEDVSFNVVTIKSGDKSRWEVQESQIRTCSVAAGKVEVRMGSNVMSMGPNSMFIIRPGDACLATNKLYIDATIHCTTVKNYSM